MKTLRRQSGEYKILKSEKKKHTKAKKRHDFTEKRSSLIQLIINSPIPDWGSVKFGLLK